MSVIDIIARLKNEASPQAKQVAQDITGIDKAAGTANTSVGGLGKVMQFGLAAGAGVAVAGIGLLTKGILGGIEAAAEAQQAKARLAQTIESMGDVTGYTVDELDQMATALERSSMFTAEQVMSGQAMLLTFGNIGREALPRTTELMVDMATVFGNVDAAAVQLGKALNDPTKGLTALTRVGVSFTEQQGEQIKALQASGDMMGAQTIILDELTRQFGGQAAAAAETFTGRIQQISNRMGEMQEVVGNALLPSLIELSNEVIPALEQAAVELQPVIQSLADENLPGMVEGVTELVREIPALVANLDEAARAAKLVYDIAFIMPNTMQKLGDVFGDLTDEIDDNAERLDTAYTSVGIYGGGLVRLTSSIEGHTREVIAEGNAYDYLIPKVEAVTTATQATTGAYDSMIQTSIINENRMEHYGERLGEVDEAQEDVDESARRMAAAIDGIVAGAMERSSESISTIVGLYGELEEAGGEWVTSTVDNSGRIATIHGQLMADLDEETKKGYQEILNTAAEGSAEWLAAYQALQGDLTQAQRNELVARIADLQASSGEAITVYTGDAEAVEEIQGQINEQWALIATGHRQMVVDILVQQAEMEGGFNRSIANVMVATGQMTQAEAELQLQTQETARQVGAVGDALITAFLEDGSISRAEAALIEESIAGIESGAFTAGQVIGAMARDGLGEFISQAGLATTEADRFLQKVQETEGDYQVNINTNYTQTGEPPPGLGGGAVGGAGAGGGATGGGGAGFATGGFTGFGPVNEIAGYVHKQEYVFDADAVSRIGRGNLEALHQGGGGGGDTYYITVNAPGATAGTAQQIVRSVDYVMQQYARTTDGQTRMR